LIQILEVVLYSHDGRTRSLPLEPGRLNVITGESESGKSALLEIIRYCLASSDFGVPEGVISRAVAWYGLRLQVPGGEVFVARPRPDAGRLTTTDMMFRHGRKVAAPPPSEMAVNSNVEVVEWEIGRLMGLAENASPLSDTATRRQTEAKLDHSLFFCLQRQGEVANRDLLFHRQAEDFVGTAIRDVLPYFLGAVPPDYVLSRARLRQTQKELAREEQLLARAQASKESERNETILLLNEAHEVGLIEAQRWEEIADVAVLRHLLDVALNSNSAETQVALAGEAFTSLRTRRAELAAKYREMQATKVLAERLLGEQKDYTGALESQDRRMAAVELLPDPAADGSCPVCGQLAPDMPTVRDLRADLEGLRESLSSASRDEPRLTRILSKVEEDQTDLADQLSQVQASMDELAREAEVVERVGRLLNEQSYVRGRIDHFVKASQSADDPALAAAGGRILELKRLIRLLEQKTDYDTVRDNVTSTLNLIGQDMLTWAHELQLGYAEGAVRIDWAKLTVVADRAEGRTPLNKMGGGKNWVGYHLISYLALHKHFIENKLPVPSFVVFDQPTQAFYPPSAVGPERKIQDSDRASVGLMFALLREVAAQLAPRLQIIVMDHENPDRPGLPAVVVEEWREGRKLVPADWPQRA
jgi:hypothetical protein